MPLFSVVIPVFNRTDLLREALKSVFAQEFADYEVIVVDDGSTDDISAVVREFGGRAKLLRQENSGPGAARNLGIANASGEYIAFLDSDDLWFPWTLETYATVIGRCHRPAFIAGKPSIFRDETELSAMVRSDATLNEFADYYASGDEWRWWGASSFVVRTDAIRAVGGFTPLNINAEDADLAMRLGVAEGFVQICAPATFGYREHGGCVTSSLERTLGGLRYMLSKEKSRAYPGGRQRRGERRRIITRHLRPVTLECLKQNRVGDAWFLYLASAHWHLLQWRFKYLFGFVVRNAARLGPSTSLTRQLASGPRPATSRATTEPSR